MDGGGFPRCCITRGAEEVIALLGAGSTAVTHANGAELDVSGDGGNESMDGGASSDDGSGAPRDESRLLAVFSTYTQPVELYSILAERSEYNVHPYPPTYAPAQPPTHPPPRSPAHPPARPPPAHPITRPPTDPPMSLTSHPCSGMVPVVTVSSASTFPAPCLPCAAALQGFHQITFSFQAVWTECPIH